MEFVPTWAEILKQWVNHQSSADELMDVIRSDIRFAYPTKEDMKKDAKFIKGIIVQAFPVEMQELYNEEGLYSRKVKGSARANLHRNFKCKINRVFDRLVNEIHGYEIKANLNQKFEEVAETKVEEEMCQICTINNSNVNGCENNHKLCHICFAQIVIKNKGKFICPYCRSSEDISEWRREPVKSEAFINTEYQEFNEVFDDDGIIYIKILLY